jgi:hypothetical protein
MIPLAPSLRILLLFAFAASSLTASPPARAADAAADWSDSYNEGMRLLREDRFTDAIRHLQRAIEVNPDAPEPYAAIRLAAGLRGRLVGEVARERVLVNLAHDALRDDQLDRAEEIAKSLAEVRFGNPEAHLLLQWLHAKRGRQAASEHARKIVTGLLAVMLDSGDGKTLETAYLVQGVNEEYMLLGYVFHCWARKQEVLFPPAGGVYDALTAECADGERVLYFDVTVWGLEPAWRLKTYRTRAKPSP